MPEVIAPEAGPSRRSTDVCTSPVGRVQSVQRKTKRRDATAHGEPSCDSTGQPARKQQKPARPKVSKTKAGAPKLDLYIGDAGDPTLPSGHLLRSLHVHASQFYTAQGKLPEPDAKKRRGRPSKRDMRRDMRAAIDSEALVVMGMLVQELVREELKRNGLTVNGRASKALAVERRLSSVPQAEDAGEAEEGAEEFDLDEGED